MSNLGKVASMLWVFSVWFMVISGNEPSWQLFIFSLLTGLCILGIALS